MERGRCRYLLHFDTPFRHGRHGLGSMNNLSERLVATGRHPRFRGSWTIRGVGELAAR